MRLTVTRAGNGPIYRQIINQIRDQIRSGSLPPGTRLPPVRQLAAAHGLTRLTVHSAYAELQAQGLIESHVGRGTFVAAGAGRSRSPAPWRSQGVLADLLRMDVRGDTLSFAQAFPAPETYPARELGRAVTAALREPSVLGYGPIQGEATLLEQIARLLLDRGLAVSSEEILVTAGAQQAVDVALRALTEPGDSILVEEPVYPGVLELTSLRGQRVIGVPNDGGKLRIDALEAACAAHRPRLLYLIPTFNNPTGISLAADRREAVLRAASAHDMVVVEDDTYGFMGLDGAAPHPLKADDRDDRVVYITTFSKTLAPALRLGAIVAPASLLPGLAAAKQSTDLFCSSLLQRALADYLRHGFMAAHLDNVRTLYRERRDAMLSALERYLPHCTWTEPEGGLSLWVTLPDGVLERDFTADAFARGVGISPGSVFFPQPQGGAAMRLSFGMYPPERIEKGVATLGGVLESYLRRRFTMPSLAGRGAGPLV